MDTLVNMLTSPILCILLLYIGTMGIVLEMLFVKRGLFAILGFASFGLYFWGQFAAGYAYYSHITLFVIGIVLILLELVVINFGISGIAGGICIYAGIVMAGGDSDDIRFAIVAALLLSIVTVIIAIRFFKQHMTWNRFVLRDQLTTEEGYISSPDYSYLWKQRGIAITPLRPAGTVIFGEERVDVVTQGDFIPSGSEVEVTQVEGVRIVVTQIHK
ncbi:nodulation efficiency protein NfeD [Paenibacillus albiflavus]|uniref:Nodulation efficiency protein NfeD n=1 Tax=Paenibacillus albiflavus TaxID=2545760 RepID=A0A4R4ECC7_9BACL|nr:NfeD family protein [Paenibacillus albiflavus]TCZ75588.1 nodulation efficiency protein NfeD [Paenibacillus albiflavus]